MKVFTVGLDQKPPMEEVKPKPEKSADSPPPGYSTTESRIPLPLGPELPRPPLPPQPIIVRKSRGYKGILLVMLAVFLMAVFALTLSEMAYNRQREENFFKLRWAELKHRLGYENEGPFDYYHRAASSIGEKFDRLLSLAKSNELPEAAEQRTIGTSTTSTEVPSAEPPVVAIDSFPPHPQQNAFEPEQPAQMQQMFGHSPFGQVRDARLQFLRNILSKIKQHAEDIGFDGTMQVSIIEVEPQNGAAAGENGDSSQSNNNNGNELPQQMIQNWAQRMAHGHPNNEPQQQQLLQKWAQSVVQQAQQQQPQFPPQMMLPLPQHFFPHPRPLMEDFKNSRAFLDGFGEMAQPPQPNFGQNNHPLMMQQPEQPEQPPQEQRPRMFGPWGPHPQPMMGPNEFAQHQPQQQNGPDFMENMPRWPRVNPFRASASPDLLFFHPIFPQQLNLRFAPPPPPAVNNDWAQQQQQQPQLPRPSAFDRWNGPQPPQPQQPQPPQFQQLPMMQMGAGQPAEQPQQPPQHQQIQIDFPEVKLPAPIFNNENAATEDKIPPPPGQPGQQQNQQPQQQQQQQEKQPLDIVKPDEQLPQVKWEDNNGNSNSNNNNNDFKNVPSFMDGSHSQVFGAGPPAVQPPSDIVKFPSVTVVEPAKNVADNEETTQGTQAPTPSSEMADKKELDDTVEVDASQPIVPQNNQKEESKQQPDNNNNHQQQQPAEQRPAEMQPPVEQPSPPGDGAQQSPQQQFQHKWFPEVPSVFFQTDNSSEEIEKSEKMFESMVQNMKKMVGKMFGQLDDGDSGTESVVRQVDDPHGSDIKAAQQPASSAAQPENASGQTQQLQMREQPQLIID